MGFPNPLLAALPVDFFDAAATTEHLLLQLAIWLGQRLAFSAAILLT